jgi:ribonuclease HII
MAVVIGIDEAGYGPVLGPLVVSSAAFDVAGCSTAAFGCEHLKSQRGAVAPRADADLWELLGPAVARTRRGAAGRVLVADSKVVYRGGKGLADLECAVLAFLASSGGPHRPSSFRELLRLLCDDADALCDAAWWSDIPLPAAATQERIDAAAQLLGAAQGGVRSLGLAAQVLRPGEFNELIARHKNKAVVLFQQNMLLVRRAMAQFEGDICFVIDKHGGRHYYGPLLSNNFFGHAVRVRRESPHSSLYELKLAGRTLSFAFIEKADALHLPVALASMACKYVRELFMMCFNAYWCGRVKGLAPTAGYAADSGRFIDAIRPFINESNEHHIIRQR